MYYRGAHRWSPKNSQPPGISCILQLWTLAYRSLLGYSLGPDKLKRAPVGGGMSSKRLFHRFSLWVLGSDLPLVPFLHLGQSGLRNHLPWQTETVGNGGLSPIPLPCPPGLVGETPQRFHVLPRSPGLTGTWHC